MFCRVAVLHFPVSQPKALTPTGSLNTWFVSVGSDVMHPRFDPPAPVCGAPENETLIDVGEVRYSGAEKRDWRRRVRSAEEVREGLKCINPWEPKKLTCKYYSSPHSAPHFLSLPAPSCLSALYPSPAFWALTKPWLPPRQHT